MYPCAHLCNAVRIAAVNVEQLKIHDDIYQGTKLRSHTIYREEKQDSNWNCVSCGTSEHPWLCLSCGLIHCGRYKNGDGLAHFKHYDEHTLSMHCHDYSVFCYKCDDFVFDDTIDKKIESIRGSLKFHNSSRSGDHCYSNGCQEEDSDTDSESQVDEGTEDEDVGRGTSQLSVRPDGDRDEEPASVLEDTPEETGTLLGGRMLRPRKRKVSPIDASEVPLKGRPIDNQSMSSGQSTPSEIFRSRGLRNLGNTCFMNAILQALNSVDVFREFMVSLPLLEPEETKTNETSPLSSPRYKTRRYATSADNKDSSSTSTVLAEELRRTLIELSTASVLAFSPDALFSTVGHMCSRFIGYQQHDSHEFLRYFLDRLHNDLRRCRIPDGCGSRVAACCGVDYSPSASAVSLMFEGALQSQVTCMTCQMTSNKQDPFLDLSLDIFVPMVVAQKATTVNLVDCIRRFFEKEELEQCEQYMCGRCEARRPSTKQLFLRCMPKVLCLHLKRFRWSHMSRGKLDNMVDFPLRGLDMAPFLAPSTRLPRRNGGAIFDLSAIVVHHGSGVSSGHYTSYGRRGPNGQWYHFNDSSVKPSNPELVLKQKAYLLFYTRVN